MLTLSKILDVDSTSKGKDQQAFWNEQCAEISSQLWLPTANDLQDLGANSSSKLLSSMLETSWFSSNVYIDSKPNLSKRYSISSQFLVTKCADNDIIKSKLIRIYPNQNQRKVFYYWLGTARYVYNQTINLLKNYEGKKPSWMDIKKMFTRLLPTWTKDVPFQIKGIAIKQAHAAFFATLKACKGKSVSFRFRSRKDLEQSCFIPKTAIKAEGIYHTVSGKGLRFSESLPESVLDSCLVWKSGKFYLAVPYKTQVVSIGDNQARLVAIDPGVRKFFTFYTENSCGFVGQADFSRLQRQAFHLDKLILKSSEAPKQRKQAMFKAANRMRTKIKNLVNELHHKAALFMVKNFDVILLPTFETKQMTSKAGRKLQSKTVRSLLSFAHYRFKQFLKNKAVEYGKSIVDVCEAYTSKTHPQTGEIRNIGGAKVVKLLDGSVVDRDIVGARNILLRALVDKPDYFDVVAVNHSC
ncbi:MAG: hypothetical protein RL368_1074 [Pseudomonadota bacterium]|jgi:putative transposase